MYGTVSYAEDRMGNSNGALSLAGAQDCGSIGDTDCPGLACGSTLNDKIANANTRTVCAWAYVESFNDGAIFQSGSGSDCELSALRTQASGGWKSQNWGGCDVDMSSYGTSTSTWQHHCSVYDGVTLSHYIDAAAVASSSVSLITASGSEFYIGFYGFEDGNSFDGKLDEVRARLG